MSTETLFTVFDKHQEIALDQVGKNGFTTLFGGGIVNPFGPTLIAVVIDGDISPGSKRRVLQLMLHPLSQYATEVGVAEIGDTGIPVHQIAKFFTLECGSCPTLLLPSALLKRKERRELYAHFFAKFEDGRSVFEEVEACPGDPQKRVLQDLNLLEALSKYIDGRRGEDLFGERLTPQEAITLADHLLKRKNLKAELRAFMMAWDGSIEFDEDGIMGENGMSLETFLEYFDRLAMSCDLPKFSRR